MKKIISIFVVAALLMSLMVSVFATDTETPTLTVGSATAEVGEEITLDVTMSAATFAAFGLDIDYDETALELTKVGKGEALEAAEEIVVENEGVFTWIGSAKRSQVTVACNANMDIDGVLFTLTFTVLAEGQHTVNLEINKFVQADQSKVEVTPVAGTITATDVTPAAPSIEDGKYVISYGDYTYQALNETYTYGYAPAGDNNAHVAADLITITNVEGGFTMQDCYGRYIYMSGTYNNFNVNTEAPTEGHIWTLVEVEGGYYIQNVLKEKYISYSTSYGTWGSYASAGDNSVLTITLHECVFVEGVCFCGETDPDYVAPGESETGEGSIVVETTDTYCYIDEYTMTAPATALYTFYIPAGLGIIESEDYYNWGYPIVDYYDNDEGFTFDMQLTEGEEFTFLVGATTRGEWTITYTYVVNEGEGGEGGEEGGEEGGIPADAVALTIGQNQIQGADITFYYTATEAGTLVLNLGNAIMGPVEAVVTVNYTNDQNLYTMGQITLELAEGDVVLVAFTATGYATLTAEWTAGSQGGEDPEIQYNNLVIGNNSISQADINFIYTATEAGELALELTPAIMGTAEAAVYVNGELNSTMATSTTLTLTLNADDVVTILVTATGYSTLKAAWTAGSQGEEPDECEHEFVDGVCTKCGAVDPDYVAPSEPDGTSDNPFIIEELPYTAEQETTDDLYYEWTAPEDGFLYVYYTNGSVSIEGSSVASWEYCDGGKYVEVAAGDVITINYWSGTGFTVEFVPASEVVEYVYIESLNITLTIADDGIAYAWVADRTGDVVIRIAETTWSYGYSLTINGESLFGAGSEMTIAVTEGDLIVIEIAVYASASSDGHLTLEEVVEETHECTFGEWTVVTPATCEQDGEERRYCECGEYESRVIEATGHSFGEWTVETPATCEQDGEERRYCECGHYETRVIEATGHTYVDGECECGAEDPDYVAPECEHEFVDGVCTKCGEPDPEYNPETGSMNIFAVALIAAMSVTAVVVTAKKREE